MARGYLALSLSPRRRYGANYGISGQSAVTVSILYGSIQLVADLSGGLLRLTDQ